MNGPRPSRQIPVIDDRNIIETAVIALGMTALIVATTVIALATAARVGESAVVTVALLVGVVITWTGVRRLRGPPGRGS